MKLIVAMQNAEKALVKLEMIFNKTFVSVKRVQDIELFQWDEFIARVVLFNEEILRYFSVAENWLREIDTWLPSVNYIHYKGMNSR